MTAPDLAAFIEQRLAEDEAAAKAAASRHGPVDQAERQLLHGEIRQLLPGRSGSQLERKLIGLVDRYCADQIAADRRNHDPARVLAEVAAKREMLRLHGPMSVQPGHPYFNDAHLTREPMRLCRSCEPETMFRRERSWPCRTLLQLAAIWSSHPDYDPAWAPSTR